MVSAALITELLVWCWDALFCAAPQAHLRCIGPLPQPLGPHEWRLVALGAVDLMDALPRLPCNGVQALHARQAPGLRSERKACGLATAPGSQDASDTSCPHLLLGAGHRPACALHPALEQLLGLEVGAHN